MRRRTLEVIFEAEISAGDYEQARRLWNDVGDRYIKQFEFQCQ